MANSVAGILRALKRRKLHGEVPDGRAFNDPAGKWQSGFVGCQPIQKRVTASAAYNVDPFKVPSGEPDHIMQDFSVTMRQAVEDETRKNRKRRGVLWNGCDALRTKLPIDQRWKISRQQ
jgi:hypothetical protein